MLHGRKGEPFCGAEAWSAKGRRGAVCGPRRDQGSEARHMREGQALCESDAEQECLLAYYQELSRGTLQGKNHKEASAEKREKGVVSLCRVTCTDVYFSLLLGSAEPLSSLLRNTISN